jgi:uncharacterized protein DUF1236
LYLSTRAALAHLNRCDLDFLISVLLFALEPQELLHSNRFAILPSEQPVHVDRAVLARHYKFPASIGDICWNVCSEAALPWVAAVGTDQRSDRMSLNRNSRKQKLLMAVAAAAFICGSDFALAQRGEGGGGMQGGAGMQGGERSGAREDSGKSGGTQRAQPGMREKGGAEQKGSNARGAQGPERRDLTPGERGSNTRGAQGPERGRGTTGQGMDRTQERSGTTSREQRGRDRSEGSTTGQSDRREGTTGQSERRFEGSTDRRDRSTTTERGERSRSETNVNVEINEQQRSRIRDVVVSRRNIPRVSNVNFDIRVGTVVPRTVRFVTVPEEIVTIYPRFRRHRIVIVQDEILIIDPVTFRIVAVLPA